MNEPNEPNEPKRSLRETVGRLVELAVAGRWLILAPVPVVTLVGIWVGMSLPDRYTSEAMLVLLQPQISPRYVDPLSTMSNIDTVTAIRREVLSTSRMLGIIHSFGLYDAEMRGGLRPEQLAARLREDVKIEFVGPQGLGRDPSAFTVSFTARTPQLAQEVASRVATMFIEENLKTRESQAATTTTFLAEQIGAAKQKLAQQEQKLRDFKTRNAGELPEQQHAVVAALTDLRIQLQNTMANLSRARQQQKSAESLFGAAVARLQSERTALLTRFTPRHPEVLKKDREIERLGSLLARPKEGQPVSQRIELPSDHEPAITQVRNQLENSVVEIDNLLKEERRLASEIAQYQNRLRLTPLREQELSAILRDYDLFKQDYADLLDKQLRAQLTASVEEHGVAQQFRLIEPPTLPISPSSPKRLMIGLGAAAAGLVLGIALAFLAGMWDHSYHTEKEVRQHVAIPLVIGIPMLYTSDEVRGRRRRRALEWVAGSALIVVVAAAEFYVYRHG